MFAAGNTQPKVEKAKCAGICVHESLPQLQMLSEWIKHSRKCHVQHEASSLHELMGFFARQWAGPQNYSDFCFAPRRVWFHNPARDCASDSPRDEPVQCSIVSRFSMGWACPALPFPLCKTNQVCCSLLLAPGNHQCDRGEQERRI